jgi:hypothetical protein
MPRPLTVLLLAARRALHVGSQGDLGVLLGSSVRSGQRWETGRATPSYNQVKALVARVHPHDRALAEELAASIGGTVVSLGIAPPPAPPPPPPPPPPPVEDVVDAVVCAAAEAMNVTPREVRPALLAAFTRARRLSLAVDAVEGALARGGSSSAQADAPRPAPSRAPKPAP